MKKKIVNFKENLIENMMLLGLTPMYLENPGFLSISNYLGSLLGEINETTGDEVITFNEEIYNDSRVKTFSFEVNSHDKVYSFSIWSNVDNCFAYELKEKFRKVNFPFFDKYYQGKVTINSNGEITMYDAVTLIIEDPVVKLESVGTKKIYNGYGVVEYEEKRAFNRDIYGINKIYDIEENMAVELFDGGTYENLWYERREIVRSGLTTAEVTSSKKNMYKGIDVTYSVVPIVIENGLSEIVLPQDINKIYEIKDFGINDENELINQEKNEKVQEGLRELSKRNKVLVR